MGEAATDGGTRAPSGATIVPSTPTTTQGGAGAGAGSGTAPPGQPPSGSGAAPGGMTLEEAQARNTLPDGWTFGTNQTVAGHYTALRGGQVAVFQNGQWVNTTTGDFMTQPEHPSAQIPY
jgi:hypothetical protein